MPRYEVTSPGFINNTYHKPGCPRHGFVITDKPFAEGQTPPWLKLVKEESSAESKSRKESAEKIKETVKKQQQEVKGASFMDDDKKQGGVETL